jgi:DNA-binding IclR family transcriptional regulator
LDINKVNVYRILTALENVGWISQNKQNRKYTLGPLLMPFSLTVIAKSRILNISLPYLYELSETTDESAQLSIRIGLERVYVQEVPGKEARLRIPLGKPVPLWSGAVGLSMLAFLEKTEIREVLNQMKISESKQRNPCPEENKILKKLELIRKSGYCISVAERRPFIRSIAAPIFDDRQRVIGALSVRGLVPRFNTKIAKLYFPIVLEAANNVTLELNDINQTC